MDKFSLFYTDLNSKGAVHQAFEMYRLKSCVDFKPYEGEKTFIKFEKRDGYVCSQTFFCYNISIFMLSMHEHIHTEFYHKFS